MEIRFDLCWWLGQGQLGEVEPELFQLLHSIEEGGSLRVAAKERGVSYRHAWGLMQKWERILGRPLARLERGRGAVLTPVGQKLLWGQRRLSAHLAPELESFASELSAELRQVMRAETLSPVRIFASHGLAIARLRDLLWAKRVCAIDLQFRGSLDSLRLLSSSKCDIAGFHLPEGSLGVRLAPRFRRCLDPEGILLIHVVRRRQGFITALNNPKQIRSVRDIAATVARFVNRQPGSGTRMIFDLLLEDAQIDPAQISGYNAEEFTHMAVAAMVASGGAEIGFGIEAASSQFKLSFIPVTWENYWFALRRDILARPAVSEIVNVLRSTEFKEQVGALPGYDASQSGTVMPVEAVIAYGELPRARRT